MHIYDYTMKHYKPGQFVSIGGKLAKVCKNTNFRIACKICIKANYGTLLCSNGCISECHNKLGDYLFPKLIKQCKKQEKQ